MMQDAACLAGIFEHPLRKAPDKTTAQLHAEVAYGALADAGLSLSDVDGYFCAGDAPGFGPMSMLEYLNINPRFMDTTETGGSSYLIHVSRAVHAIASGQCSVALITMAGRPRSESGPVNTGVRGAQPDQQWESPFGPSVPNLYAMFARRHMYQYGTTSEQLAWIKVAASEHAQHNPYAMLRKPVTVEDVLASPMVADPLHRLDCCVVSDGGGAAVLVRPEIARSLRQPVVQVRGMGEAIKHQSGGRVDLTWSAAGPSGQAAFEQARIKPSDIGYASIYDSFTITVLTQLEDLGFCEKGAGGAFVADGKLIAGQGKLAVNTDGGGLCNNHPSNRGGIVKLLEAVRQLRGQAHPAVQVPNCSLAVAQAIGGALSTRHVSATLVLERVQ